MKRLTFHPKLCVGCYACEVACKGEHRLPPEIKWIKVVRDETPEGGMPRVSFQVRVCKQCETPPCLGACPVGAISRSQDGQIILEGEKCNGCRECLDACPWEAIGFDSVAQRASKCNLCADLGQPRCPSYCPTGALAIAAFPDPESSFPRG